MGPENQHSCCQQEIPYASLHKNLQLSRGPGAKKSCPSSGDDEPKTSHCSHFVMALHKHNTRIIARCRELAKTAQPTGHGNASNIVRDQRAAGTYLLLSRTLVSSMQCSALLTEACEHANKALLAPEERCTMRDDGECRQQYNVPRQIFQFPATKLNRDRCSRRMTWPSISCLSPSETAQAKHSVK